MTDQIKTLDKIGLNNKQANVYLALLELGEAKITDIAKQANLKRPTVYLIIAELELQGLVSVVVKGKKKIYSAAHPKRIGELLEFRKTQFQKILPDLLSVYGSINGRPKIQILEGMEGVAQAYREALSMLPQKNNEQLWISNVSSIAERFPEIMSEYVRVLSKFPKSKIREILFGKKIKTNYLLKIKSKVRPNHQVKNIDDPNWGGQTDQLIIENKVMFFSIKPEPFALTIESAEIAKTQKFMFENLWKGL